MEAEVRNRPSFANIHVQLGAGDAIVAEADAMASMSSSIEMSTRFNGYGLDTVISVHCTNPVNK